MDELSTQVPNTGEEEFEVSNGVFRGKLSDACQPAALPGDGNKVNQNEDW
jgi:hypothetical protein